MISNKQLPILLLSVIIFCLISTFLYLQIPASSGHADIDSKAYTEKALLFYSTNSFASPGQEQPYYTLGYPFFIGILYRLFGTTVFPIILAQILLVILSCFLIMRVAQRLFNQQAGYIAAFLCSINLGYLIFTQFILTEILLSFFLLLFFERLTKYLAFDNNTQKTALIQSGLALGTSIIVKPAAIFFIFPICLLLLIFTSSSWLKKIVTAFVFAASFYLPVIGYMTYNKIVFNNFSVSRLDSVNFYYWFFANVRAQEFGTTSAHERTNLMQLAQQRGDGHVRELFWQELKIKPLLFAYVWLLNVAKTFGGLYVTNLKVLLEPKSNAHVSFFTSSGGLLSKTWHYVSSRSSKAWVIALGIFEALWSFARYVLCLFGLLYLYRKQKWFFLLLTILFIAYFSLITGHDGCARFRMMLESILIVLAAGGLSILCDYDTRHAIK